MFICAVPKISQVMMKRRCRASHLTDISVDFLCGATAAELHNSVDLLCGTTAAKLHNSVDLFCGTTAAELHNSVDLLLKTFERFSQHRSVEDLQQTLEICTLYENSANF